MKQGWELKALCEVCETFADGDWIEKKDQAESGIRLLQTGNVGQGVFKDRPDKARFISDSTFDSLNCKEVICGDVLISRLPDPVGRACVVPQLYQRLITAVDCTIVRTCTDLLDPFYLVYFCCSNSYLSSVAEQCTGTTRQRISRKSLGKITIPLPPLEEQKRIVAVLDEAFEGLETARTNAEENLKNAEELFQRCESDLFDTLPNGPDSNKLSSVVGSIQTGPFGSLLHKRDYVSEGVPVVNPINISNGKIIVDKINTVSEAKAEQLKSYKLFAGDIVIGRRGEMGRCAVVEGWQQGWLCGTGSFIIRMENSVLKPDYLQRFLSSENSRKTLNQLSSGTTMPNLSNTSLRNLLISVPDLQTQNDLLSQLSFAAENIAKLRALYQMTVNNISDLRQSLLQKAFAGELT